MDLDSAVNCSGSDLRSVNHSGMESSSKCFKCEQCPAEFVAKQRPNAHMIVHSDSPSFACVHCDKQYKHKQHLSNHMKNVHSFGWKENTKIKCNLCNKEFVNEKNIRRHMFLHYPNGHYVCDICDKVFEHSALFKTHKTICVPPSVLKVVDNRYSCNWCLKNFLTKFRLESHIVVHSPDRNFRCPHCPRRFKRKRHVPLHIKNVHKSKKKEVPLVSQPQKYVKAPVNLMDKSKDGELFCSPCNKIFQNLESYRMHSIIFHDPANPQCNDVKKNKTIEFFQCEHCDAVFPHKCRLRDHMVRHGFSKDIKCYYCEELFRSRYHVRQHIFNCHSEKQQNVVLMILCDEKFEQIVHQEVRIFHVDETVDNRTTELERIVYEE